MRLLTTSTLETVRMIIEETLNMANFGSDKLVCTVHLMGKAVTKHKFLFKVLFLYFLSRILMDLSQRAWSGLLPQ